MTDDPVGSAFDGVVGLAVAVVVAANGLRARLGKYDCLDVAVAAVDGIEGFVRGSPDGDVRPAVAVVIGRDGNVVCCSPGAVIEAIGGAEDVPIVIRRAENSRVGATIAVVIGLSGFVAAFTECVVRDHVAAAEDDIPLAVRRSEYREIRLAVTVEIARNRSVTVLSPGARVPRHAVVHVPRPV